MHTLRNAVVFALALVGALALVREKLQVRAPASTPREVEPEPAFAPKPAQSLRLARIEPLPDGRLFGVFTLEASTPLTIALYPATPGGLPWLAYTGLHWRQDNGEWTGWGRGCCDERVVKTRLEAGASLEVAALLPKPNFDASKTARLAWPGMRFSEPFELDHESYARDGHIDRAYDRQLEQLTTRLRELGFTRLSAEEDPARAVTEALIEWQEHHGPWSDCSDVETQARRALAYFQLTGDLRVDSAIDYSKSCARQAQVEISMEPAPTPRWDELAPTTPRGRATPNLVRGSLDADEASRLRELLARDSG
ncbi:MAG: hypothetical protein H6713_06200 [Myxococcales bacterium]|nr:hypothetical protein [Myxococcales bacterium]